MTAAPLIGLLVVSSALTACARAPAAGGDARASALPAAPAQTTEPSSPPDVLPGAGGALAGTNVDDEHAFYPVGRACSGSGALESEKRSVPPRSTWDALVDDRQHLRMRIPPSVFTRTDDANGLELVSAVCARELGDDAGLRAFAIRIRRVASSIDALLTNRGRGSELSAAYVDDAFPKRTEASFVVHREHRMGSGSSARSRVAGKPAYVWVDGVEGYDTDWVLVALGSEDTIVVEAKWNGRIMGQPECWQRVIIGGVVESIRPE